MPMRPAINVLLAASALLYFPLAFEEFDTPKAFALVAFACFAAPCVRWRQIKTDKVAQALAAFTVSAAASSALSIDWHMSIFGNPKCPMGLLVIAAYFVLYLATESLETHIDQAKAISVMLWCALAVAAYSILQVMGIDPKVWTGTLQANGYTRPMSFQGHPNFYAQYLAMLLPFALYQKHRVLAVIMIGAVFLSQSRGMWLATGAGLVVYSLLDIESTAKKVLPVLAAGAIIVVIGTASVPGLRATALDRLDNIVSPGPARLEYWKGALRIWKRAPMLGIGTDAFELGWQHQRTPEYWKMEHSGSPHRAHNEILNVMACQGLLGLAAILFVCLALALRAWRSTSPFRAPTIAALVAFGVGSMSSFTVISVGVVFILCARLLKGDECEP